MSEDVLAARETAVAGEVLDEWLKVGDHKGARLSLSGEEGMKAFALRVVADLVGLGFSLYDCSAPEGTREGRLGGVCVMAPDRRPGEDAGEPGVTVSWATHDLLAFHEGGKDLAWEVSGSMNGVLNDFLTFLGWVTEPFTDDDASSAVFLRPSANQ
jgi:hypothetical protein